MLYEVITLGIYLTPEPEKGSLTKAQKDENKKMLELAETIRSKRFMEIQNDRITSYNVCYTKLLR